MLFSWPIVAVVLLFTAGPALLLEAEVQLERFEQTLGFHLCNATGIRVGKFNRTTYVLNGTAEVFQDFGDDYLFTLSVAHSRIGNNQFNEYPMKVHKQKACDILNGPYKDYQQHFVRWTNLPVIGDERYCPFPAGQYWVKNFAPDGDWVLPVIPEGLWRFTGEVYNLEDEMIIKLAGYFRLTRKLV